TGRGRWPPKLSPHEDATVKMLDHLVERNNLREAMEQYGLELPRDLDFIKEMIHPKSVSSLIMYQGQEKSFLYEIVSNSTNGIDVDKFDYFARDSHHLGIQNNFDHRRFLKFARVCEVDGQRHICSRDKEKDNLIDMFHTRTGLYRRACYHRVTDLIQIMISDAFLKADEFIQIEGSGGKMFKLSTAIDDMEAYTKLTDDVFEQILHSTSADLRPAREILERIRSRHFYVLLGEIQAEMPSSTVRINVVVCWVRYLLTIYVTVILITLNIKVTFLKTDFKVDVNLHFLFLKNCVTMTYGIQDKEPIEPIKSMYFYRKRNPTKAFTHLCPVWNLFPMWFSLQIIRVYWKKTTNQDTAKRQFVQWCEINRYTIREVIGLERLIMIKWSQALTTTHYTEASHKPCLSSYSQSNLQFSLSAFFLKTTNELMCSCC
uniref:Uncharacterized protein n=1 Tax=Mastacembelus armatus TaxID=205130 RepID=A0A3Q3LY02_9TELE